MSVDQGIIKLALAQVFGPKVCWADSTLITQYGSIPRSGLLSMGKNKARINTPQGISDYLFQFN